MFKIMITTTAAEVPTVYKWLDDFIPNWSHQHDQPGSQFVRKASELFSRESTANGRGNRPSDIYVIIPNEDLLMLTRLSWLNTKVEGSMTLTQDFKSNIKST